MKSGSVLRVDKKCKTKEENLIGFGDLHVGNPSFLEDYAVGWRDWFVEQQESEGNVSVILMGDLLEGPNKMGLWDLTMKPQAQMKYMIDFIKPLVDNEIVLGALLGNHEGWVYRDCGYDPMDIMCMSWGIPYFGEERFIKMKLNSMNYHLFCLHGKSSATSLSGKMGALARMEDGREFDVGLMGHIHFKHVLPVRVESIDNKDKVVLSKRRLLVGTGHALSKPNYAARAMYRETERGFPVVMLDTNRFSMHYRA